MEKELKPIQFAAITQGLGFHPFQDGLPYAPVSKTTSSKPQAAPLPPPRERGLNSGAGANAAGPASFAYPSTARTSTPRISVPVASSRQAMVQSTSQITAQQTQATQAALKPQAFAEPSFGFFYLMKRMMAYSIDTTLNVSLLAAGLSFVLLNQDGGPEMLMNPGVLLISVLFFTLFNWALITAQEIAFGTSIGKRIFGLTVQGGTSAIFLRSFFFLPSIGFCGVGLLWALFDRKKRCWHDLVVNVQPTEVARF